MPSLYETLTSVVLKRPDVRTDFECQEIVPWFRNKSVLLEKIKPGYRTRTMKEAFMAVVDKPIENRTEFECMDLVHWFQNHSAILHTLPEEIVADVIRHCEFERKKKDDVLIQQGENGDKLYIILRGAVSIYVIQDIDDNKEVLKEVQKVCSDTELKRELLGKYVWTAGEGKSFGEIALLKDDCIRTATVIADCDTDLVVIDRNLYNRSVRDVLEKEYKQKNKFVEENPLFKHWPTKQKKMLVISLKKEAVKYGAPLTRQCNPAENIFFVLNGEIEITCDQSQYKAQYEDWWRDMETLLPGLLPRSNGSETPHEYLRRKKTQHKLVQMCLLGSNEIVGGIEIILGLPTSLENAMVTREAEVLMLSKENFERLFTKKYAHRSVRSLRERLTLRLYLYIHRSESFDSKQKSPFLKFLSFAVHDESALSELKRMKRREREEKHRDSPSFANEIDDLEEDKFKSKDAEEVSNMLKLLDIRPNTPQGKLPSVGTSQRVINDIEAGLQGWVERTKRDSPEPRGSKVARNSSFHGNELTVPGMHQVRSLRRSKTPTEV